MFINFKFYGCKLPYNKKSLQNSFNLIVQNQMNEFSLISNLALTERKFTS